MKRSLWIGLIVLALLTPLGLLLPNWLHAGSAWGEWGADEVGARVGYAPSGMQRAQNLWHAPAPDYTVPPLGDASPTRQSIGYILSALLGVGLVTLCTLALGRWLVRKQPNTGVDD